MINKCLACAGKSCDYFMKGIEMENGMIWKIAVVSAVVSVLVPTVGRGMLWG